MFQSQVVVWTVEDQITKTLGVLAFEDFQVTDSLVAYVAFKRRLAQFFRIFEEHGTDTNVHLFLKVLFCRRHVWISQHELHHDVSLVTIASCHDFFLLELSCLIEDVRIVLDEDTIDDRFELELNSHVTKVLGGSASQKLHQFLVCCSFVFYMKQAWMW